MRGVVSQVTVWRWLPHPFQVLLIKMWYALRHRVVSRGVGSIFWIVKLQNTITSVLNRVEASGRYLKAFCVGSISSELTREPLTQHRIPDNANRLSRICWMPVVHLRVRLHCSQNWHNTASQHLPGCTWQTRVATFNPTCVSILIATQGFLVLRLESCTHCSRYLTRLSARNKPTSLASDSWGR